MAQQDWRTGWELGLSGAGDKGVPDTDGAGGERGLECQGKVWRAKWGGDWEVRGHGSHRSPWSRRCHTGASFRPGGGAGAQTRRGELPPRGPLCT